MAYAEVTVVVDGAEDERLTVSDYVLLDHIIEQIGQDAESDGYPTQVYVLFHNHEPLIYVDGEPADCECIQYETDHRPYREWNTE